MSCLVCVETFNNSNRKKVVCIFCKYECCNQCFETYVLSIKDEMNCMSCKKHFGRMIQVQLCTRTFLEKKYKIHHSLILFEREKNFYPEALIEVKRVKEERKRKERLREIEILITRLKMEQRYLYREGHYYYEEGGEPKERFHMKCATPDCRGLVDEKWMCCVCGEKTCKNCFAAKQEDHECCKEDVETAKTIKNDTKPCPSCGTFIFKISGCDQMFCVSCHSSFSWKSGAIETGILHNPHYFEWIANNGRGRRNPADVGDGCGNLLDARLIRGLLVKSPSDFLANFQEIRGLILPRFRPDVGLSTLRERVSFLMGEITEETFQKKLEMKNKQVEKNREIYDLLSMFIECAIDIFMRVQTQTNTKEFTAELIELILYVNERFELISKSLKVVQYKIDEDTCAFVSCIKGERISK